MTSDIILIKAATDAVVSLTDAKLHLRLTDDDGADPVVTALIPAAVAIIETFLRRALVRQTWRLYLDGFPGFDSAYQSVGYPSIVLPKPPLQRLVSFSYVDVSGQVQQLTEQTDFGASLGPLYGFQLDAGSETQPARLTPPWARPWPPSRRVPKGVQIDFIAGFGGNISVGTTSGSAVLTGDKFGSNDVGKPISIAGAGPAAAALDSSIVSVSSTGVATLADVAGTTVAAATIYWGQLVPPEIIAAVKMQLAYLFENRGESTDEKFSGIAPGVAALCGPYVNRVA